MSKRNLKQSISNFFALSRRKQILLGIFLVLFSIILFASMFSYFDTWRIDQSELNNFFDSSSVSENIGKKFGALISHFLIFGNSQLSPHSAKSLHLHTSVCKCLNAVVAS